MMNIRTILNSILSKNIFEYVLLDKDLRVLNSSLTIDKYLESIPQVGDDIFEYFPEFIGSENYIHNLWKDSSHVYCLESIEKQGHYVNITIEYSDEGTLLLLMQNITDLTLSKQKLLQDSNESLLLNNILQKILDNQNAYVFVTHNENIEFANTRFMTYMDVSDIEILKSKNLKIYKYLDHLLTSYAGLFERVKSKEEYIVIDNDTFILQASEIEASYTLFTLTKITNLSNKLQYDSLTSAHKKEFFHKELEKLILLKETAAVIVLDLDNFKKINDTYGHQVGDEILKEFSMLIKDNILVEDIFARWGGEEFLLLLKNTTLDKATQKAQQICKLIDEHHFKHIRHLTSSLGLAWVSEKDTLHSVLFRADKALYDAKNSGKNKVIVKMLKKK